MRSWLPPVKKMPVARSMRSRRLFSSQSRRVSKSIDSAAAAPRSPEDLLVARPGVEQAAGGREDDDVGVFAAAELDEAAQDAAVVFLFLGTADRNDPAALFTVGHLAWTHQFEPFWDWECGW